MTNDDTVISEIKRKLDSGAREIIDGENNQVMYYLPKTDETLTIHEVIERQGVSLKSKFKKDM